MFKRWPRLPEVMFTSYFSKKEIGFIQRHKQSFMSHFDVISVWNNHAKAKIWDSLNQIENLEQEISLLTEMISQKPKFGILQ